jgi:outer membrane protein assembly factor BamD
MKLKSSLVVFCLLLVACGKEKSDIERTKKDAELQQSVEQLYEDAASLMKKKSFKAAAKGFAKLQELYPYSKWSSQALLMEAYCQYQAHKYDDAIDSFTIFAKLHPNDKEAPYAFYMIGLSHYERISIVERQQVEAQKALEIFQTVLELFPTCEYAKDAKFKIDFINNHLAAQEMSIGRFYQREKAYLAAINRFRDVVTKYQTTEQRPEALMRLAECYIILNMKEEFLSMYETLKLNHKDSEWFKHAQILFDKYINISEEDKKIEKEGELVMNNGVKLKMALDAIKRGIKNKAANEKKLKKMEKERQKKMLKAGVKNKPAENVPTTPNNSPPLPALLDNEQQILLENLEESKKTQRDDRRILDLKIEANEKEEKEKK